VLLASCASRARPSPRTASARDELAAIEASVGGRVGVFALDTGSGNYLGHREDERFAMCSTFKWALVAAVLGRVDRNELVLDEHVQYGPSELLEHAPTTREHVAEGSLSIEALARAAITNSDNTAANLLLTKVNGPSGLTQFFRRCADQVTRLDRNEPTLNTNLRGDERDTTSPRAMVSLLQSVLSRDVLTPASRDRLVGWLRECETGRERLRAGLPSDWFVGDKTGSGSHGAVNDVAVALPPRQAPILIASYFSDSASPISSLNAAHAAVGRIVARELGHHLPGSSY
jgi:beta-lactamase class A